MAKGDSRALELIDLGDKLWSDKRQFDSLCQEIAYQFCPDLADFTSKLVLGQDFAIDRMDSFPEQVSRELSNALSSMLRPNDRPWFKTTTLDEQIDSVEENARYLDYVTSTIRQGIYDPRSKFVRATKQADRFYTNFGQAVISVEEAPTTRDHLYYRSYHLKNCAWMDNEVGEIDNLHRREWITARAMLRKFGDKNVSQEIRDAASKTPNKEFEIRVVVMPTDEYDLINTSAKRGGKKLPFVTVYTDVANQKVIREGGLPDFPYVVPRWHLFANTQYAFSPATMIALPDARMAQMMSQILLEAGEKAVDPPIVAKQQVVIGEPNIQAGGISWVDLEHDSSLKEALDAIKLEPNMTVGFEMRKDLREMLSKAFYIDKLTLPEAGKGMTAYEVGRRLEEHVRNLLPLFEPMQIEYNTRILDKSYSTLMNMNKFLTDGSNGTPPLPPALARADVTWAFQSPIEQAQDQILVEYFKGSLELVKLGMEAGATANPLNVDKGLRDAVRGMGTPASWRKTQAEMQQEQQKIAAQRQMAEIAGAIGHGAQVAQQVGKAGQELGLQPKPGPASPLAPEISSEPRLSGAAQKAIQGSAQGNPALAGQAGLPAADVGDQGPAQTSGETPPAPGQAQQPEQVLAQLLGGYEGGGAPQAQGQPQGQQPQPEVTQLQRQGPSNEDIVYMLKRLTAQVQMLEDKMDKPKTITVKRDKGKIVGAAVGPS